ncbi:MAG: YncE family protein [Gemmatimonadota bacterium]
MLRPRHAGWTVAVAFLLVAACAASAAEQPAVVPDPGATASAQSELLYACVQDEAKIAVIDAATHEVVRVIDLTELGFSSNAKPHHIYVEPGGEFWNVSLIGDNRVVRFDRSGEIDAQYEMETPGMLAYAAGRDLLLASRSMSAVNPPSRVSLIRGGSMDGEQIDVLFPRPHPMVVSADGGWAYTGSLGVNQLAAIDLETEEVTLTSIEGPAHALVQFALSPDGRTLVASTELTGLLLVFDLADPANPQLTRSIEVGPMAFDPMFSADGRFVWVPVKGADEVVVLDTDGWDIAQRIGGRGLAQPHAVLFSADGRWAFVSNNNKADHMADPAHGDHGDHGAGEQATGDGNITVIDAASYEIVRVIELGENVTGMGIGGAD